jgi:hypothetical protein
MDIKKIFFGASCLLFVFANGYGAVLKKNTFSKTIPVHMEKTISEQWNPAFQILGMYGIQWTYYLTFQRSNIRENGSISNWFHDSYRPHFDKDSYDYNILLHSISGAGYYAYYRSFGASRKQALGFSFLSSLLFEFTIETITEKPSFQDMYQTPVLGAVLGIVLEEISMFFWGLDSPYFKNLAYLFNPLLLIPNSAWRLTSTENSTGLPVGGQIVIRF